MATIYTIATLVIGVVVGGLLAHILSVQRENVAREAERTRDRDHRKREFRGYLAELRSRVERISDDSKDPRAIPELFSSYTSLIHQFHRERAKVTGDFLPVEEFKRLAEALGRLRWEAITQDPQKRRPRDVVAEAIDVLIRFTDAA